MFYRKVSVVSSGTTLNNLPIKNFNITTNHLEELNYSERLNTDYTFPYINRRQTRHVYREKVRHVYKIPCKETHDTKKDKYRSGIFIFI